MMRRPYRFYLSIILLTLVSLWSNFHYHGEQAVTRKSFNEFPLRIGEWKGRELGLEPEILEVLRLSDYMMRHYHTGEKGHPINFYIGYYESLSEEGYHSPEFCLPGGGWQIMEHRLVDIPVDPSGTSTITANYVVLKKGLDTQLFLYWYQDRGRIITSDYWAKFYVLWDAITKNRTDGALVRISTPIGDSVEAAFKKQVEFIQSTFPLLDPYLPA